MAGERDSPALPWEHLRDGGGQGNLDTAPEAFGFTFYPETTSREEAATGRCRHTAGRRSLQSQSKAGPSH